MHRAEPRAQRDRRRRGSEARSHVEGATPSARSALAAVQPRVRRRRRPRWRRHRAPMVHLLLGVIGRAAPRGRAEVSTRRFAIPRLPKPVPGDGTETSFVSRNKILMFFYDANCATKLQGITRALVPSFASHHAHCAHPARRAVVGGNRVVRGQPCSPGTAHDHSSALATPCPSRGESVAREPGPCGRS